MTLKLRTVVPAVDPRAGTGKDHWSSELYSAVMIVGTGINMTRHRIHSGTRIISWHRRDDSDCRTGTLTG